MGAGGNQTRYHVLFFGVEINDADSPTLLRPVFIGIGTLDVAASSQHKHTFIVRNEVFLTHHFNPTFDDFSATIVAVLLGNFHQF